MYLPIFDSFSFFRCLQLMSVQAQLANQGIRYNGFLNIKQPIRRATAALGRKNLLKDNCWKTLNALIVSLIIFCCSAYKR